MLPADYFRHITATPPRYFFFAAAACLFAADAFSSLDIVHFRYAAASFITLFLR